MGRNFGGRVIIFALKKIALNPVTLSRLLGVCSQVSIVFVAPFVLEAADTNDLYRAIAWASLIAVFSSFGANAALVKFAFGSTESQNKALFGTLLLSKLTFSCIASAALFAYGVDLGFWILFVAAFTLTLNFVDYVAETFGTEEVKLLALYKIPVLAAAIIFKFFILYKFSELVVFVIYIEWPLIWVVFALAHKRKNGTIPLSMTLQHESWKQFWKLFVMSGWIWISGIVQLGWTRGLFIFLSSVAANHTANTFFLFVRIIEGFSFIPNAISTQFFPALVRSNSAEDRMKIRKQFMFNMKLVSVSIAVVAPVIMGTMVFFSDLGDVTLVSLILMSITAFFATQRIALSREIVLQQVLFLSLISYCVGAAANVLVIYLFGVKSINVIMLGYTVFIIFNFCTPIVLRWQKFEEFRKSLG